MLTVGITGPTGAGKTTFLRAVESLGGAVFDCDAVYRELLATSAPLLAAINGRFPGAVREGELDREALARRVFTDPKALDDLSAITHPYVLREVERRLEAARKAGCRLAAVDAIGLFESGLSRLCDKTVLVTAPVETRAARIMASPMVLCSSCTGTATSFRCMPMSTPPISRPASARICSTATAFGRDL